jgi:hypothetical protein
MNVGRNCRSQEVQEDFKGFPITDTVLKVDKVYEGEPGKSVEISVDGGETDKMISIPNEETTLHFKIGEKAILFLTSNKGNRPDKLDFGYYVVGQYQGTLSKSSVNGVDILKNEVHSFNLDSIADEIKSIEEENRINNLPELYLPEGQVSNI